MIGIIESPGELLSWASADYRASETASEAFHDRLQGGNIRVLIIEEEKLFSALWSMAPYDLLWLNKKTSIARFPSVVIRATSILHPF